MTKPGIRTETLQVLDYIEASAYIDTVLGFGQRQAHYHFKPELPNVDQQHGGNYLDYWHYVIEKLFTDSWGNDSYIPGTYSFADFAQETEEIFGDLNWRTIIAKVWAAEYPDEYIIWMSW
jgi:hypothetical protein